MTQTHPLVDPEPQVPQEGSVDSKETPADSRTSSAPAQADGVPPVVEEDNVEQVHEPLGSNSLDRSSSTSPQSSSSSSSSCSGSDDEAKETSLPLPIGRHGAIPHPAVPTPRTVESIPAIAPAPEAAAVPTPAAVIPPAPDSEPPTQRTTAVFTGQSPSTHHHQHHQHRSANTSTNSASALPPQQQQHSPASPPCPLPLTPTSPQNSSASNPAATAPPSSERNNSTAASASGSAQQVVGSPTTVASGSVSVSSPPGMSDSNAVVAVMSGVGNQVQQHQQQPLSPISSPPQQTLAAPASVTISYSPESDPSHAEPKTETGSPLGVVVPPPQPVSAPAAPPAHPDSQQQQQQSSEHHDDTSSYEYYEEIIEEEVEESYSDEDEGRPSVELLKPEEDEPRIDMIDPEPEGEANGGGKVLNALLLGHPLKHAPSNSPHPSHSPFSDEEIDHHQHPPMGEVETDDDEEERTMSTSRDRSTAHSSRSASASPIGEGKQHSKKKTGRRAGAAGAAAAAMKKEKKRSSTCRHDPFAMEKGVEGPEEHEPLTERRDAARQRRLAKETEEEEDRTSISISPGSPLPRADGEGEHASPHGNTLVVAKEPAGENDPFGSDILWDPSTASSAQPSPSAILHGEEEELGSRHTNSGAEPIKEKKKKGFFAKLKGIFSCGRASAVDDVASNAEAPGQHRREAQRANASASDAAPERETKKQENTSEAQTDRGVDNDSDASSESSSHRSGMSDDSSPTHHRHSAKRSAVAAQGKHRAASSASSHPEGPRESELPATTRDPSSHKKEKKTEARRRSASGGSTPHSPASTSQKNNDSTGKSGKKSAHKSREENEPRGDKEKSPVAIAKPQEDKKAKKAKKKVKKNKKATKDDAEEVDESRPPLGSSESSQSSKHVSPNTNLASTLRPPKQNSLSSTAMKMKCTSRSATIVLLPLPRLFPLRHPSFHSRLRITYYGTYRFIQRRLFLLFCFFCLLSLLSRFLFLSTNQLLLLLLFLFCPIIAGVTRSRGVYSPWESVLCAPRPGEAYMPIPLSIPLWTIARHVVVIHFLCSLSVVDKNED
eukprot:gene5788-4139_t